MKRIIILIILVSASLFAQDKYSIFFTNVRFNHQKKKFYFLRYDILRPGEKKKLKRYVRGDFEGKILKKVTKFYKGRIQSVLILNKYGNCIIKNEYLKGQLKYQLHYNSGGFIPYASSKKNLIRKIEYRSGRPVTITLYDGFGRKIRTRRYR